MAPRASLQSFLATARAALKAPAAQRTGPLTFVVGNESADLDSLCCAVVYAYLRTHSSPHNLHIPLSNLPRPDLGLRTEMTAVLQNAGLGESDLLTLSELPDLAPEDTRWVLVDHNSLTGPLKKYANHVVGCVDHHVDEDVISKKISPRVIETCGSCMSLVVEESKAAWDALSTNNAHDPDAVAEDEKLAKLGLAAILLDTINLTAEHKIREKDTSAVSFLQGKIADKHFTRDAYFDKISAVKEDISTLGFRDIFRKDYKEWEEGGMKVGISCIVQGFEHLVEKADGKASFLEEFSNWADERELDVASIMTTSNPDGQFQRELLTWGRNAKGTGAVKRFVQISGALQLEPWNGGELDDEGARLAWKQCDLTSSRKQVAPLLREALKTSGSSHL